MDLQTVCQEVMDDMEGSLGCVLADLETGLPLAAEYRAGTIMNGNMITLVSHVGIDLFRGKLALNFERSLSRDHGSSDGFVREVQLTTSTTYQFMSAVPGWDHVIFILVTNRNVSLGMGLLAVHHAVRRLEEISSRTAAPAVNPTFRPREEPSEASPAQKRPEAPRRPERDIAFDVRQQREREVARDWTPEVPPRADAGVEPESERNGASLARASSAPQTHVPEGPAPELLPREPTAPAAGPPMSSETLESSTQTAGDSTAAEKSAPSPVPSGPRARMFFKRPGDERGNSRRRRRS